MIDSDLWSLKMGRVLSTASFLRSCDVLDISFSNGDVWEVYVVMTQEQRSRGLSDVAFLDLDGMLFCYSAPSYVPFTMKDMAIDLDIAWYDYRGSLLRKSSFAAGFPDPIWGPGGFFYVLEAAAGTIPESDLEVSYG